ncbi:hypothetical protein ACFXPS_05590 [Nocardia sp. NPDC059091]|uniref:hypothetical protein n=1 Tax=unclassified Nocardia TaxID=2637762 RepID=UPI00368E9789
MTSMDVRPAGPAADLSAARFEALTAELEQLRRENAELKRLTDDVLDRESMHVYDADMERLTTAAEMERRGTPREPHQHMAFIANPGAGKTIRVAEIVRRWKFPPSPRTLPAPERPQAPELESTGAWSPGIEWDGFGR